MTLLLVVRQEIKFLSRDFFYFKRFQGFFDGYTRVKKTIKKSEKPQEIKNYQRKNFSASANNSVIGCFIPWVKGTLLRAHSRKIMLMISNFQISSKVEIFLFLSKK